MQKVFIVTGTNRTIRKNQIFELNILGMYPTAEQAEARLNELCEIGDFDEFNTQIVQVDANGSPMNVALI